MPTAVWVFVTLLPTLILNSEQRDRPLGVRDYLGWGLWALGFATEGFADQQKWNFKKDPDNVVGTNTEVQSTYPRSTLQAGNSVFKTLYNFNTKKKKKNLI